MGVMELLNPVALTHEISPFAGEFLDIDNQLNYQQQKQQQTQWCWAAVAVSIYGFYGHSLSQCSLVSQYFHGKFLNCCSTPSASGCNLPYDVGTALNGLGELDGTITNYVDFIEVKARIDNAQPIGCGIYWPGGTGHAVVVDGYLQLSSDNSQFVYVQDPSPNVDAVCMLYGTFKTSYGTNGMWGKTWLTKAP